MVTTAIYCRSCGSSLQAAAGFCHRCGAGASDAPIADAKGASLPSGGSQPLTLKKRALFGIKCRDCGEKFSRDSVYSPHGDHWLGRGVDAVCLNCLDGRFRSGMRIVDTGADWTMGSFLAMTAGAAILLETSLIAVTGQVVLLGAMGLAMAFGLMRLAWTKLGPRGEFTPGPPLDLTTASRTVQGEHSRNDDREPLGSPESYSDIGSGVEEARAVSVLYRSAITG